MGLKVKLDPMMIVHVCVDVTVSILDRTVDPIILVTSLA